MKKDPSKDESFFMVAGAGLAPATSWLCLLLQLSLLCVIDRFVVWTVPSPIFCRSPPTSLYTFPEIDL